MAPFKPEFKFMGNCSPGELVRMRTGEESSWAIYCASQGRSVQCVAVLSATGATSINLQDQGQLARDFATVPVLSYGKEYVIEPDHAGPVTILAGETKKIPGRILQAKQDWYLMTKMDPGGTMDYLLLDGSGKLYSEPGGERALFSRWRLFHEQIKRDGVHETLLQFDTSKLGGKVSVKPLGI